MLAGSLDQPHSLSTRADVIAEAYEANVIAADARYRGRQLSLGGKIKEINVNEDVGVPYVILDGGNSKLDIKCVFSAGAGAQRIATQKVGLIVVISGTLAGKQKEYGSYVMMQDCRM